MSEVYSKSNGRLRWATIATLLVVTMWLAACSTDRDPGDFFAPGEIGTLVIDATMIVDQPFPTIYLSETLLPDARFSLDDAGVSLADIRISGGGGGDMDYTSVIGRPGFYVPASAEIVQPKTTYRLSANALDGRSLSASTTTPARLVITEWLLLDNDGVTIRRTINNGDTLRHSDGLLEARFDRGNFVSFQVGLTSLDRDSDLAVDVDFLDDEDIAELDSARDNNSPPLEAEDGVLRLPWFAILFQERYDIAIYTIDRNWFDLVRSVPEFGGGGIGFGGQAGDNFERPLFNVNGGIGLFGSGSVDIIQIYVLPAN